MVLVDTTVWIDLFAGHPTPQVAVLSRLVDEGADLCLCGVVLTEVLQGIRDERQYRRVADAFGSLVFLEMPRSVFVAAAGLYRALRRRGVTIRQPIDCMIAAVAIHFGVPLLHHDRDFDAIARHSRLALVPVRA